ncbi:MAG: hypothetical protein ACI37T_03195 [Candidatus Gastranaerophilaceae bacterium]
MFEQLKKKYPSLSDFFESMIINNKVPNSIILHGPDVLAQYFFALTLARGANCTELKTIDCNCPNCRWIKANEHPEVMTVSKIDSKPDGDDSKSVISIKQINAIKDKLVVSSDYHRFFIFCDAESRELSVEEKQRISDFAFLKTLLPKNSEKGWFPMGLTSKCFGDITANALLKAIEEPPANVSFIFLTENVENIISTIVSRSQAFYVPGFSKEIFDYGFLIEPLSNYPYIDRRKAIMISDFLIKYSKDTGKSMLYIVSSIQSYLTELARQNVQNRVLVQKILEDIEKLQNVVNMLNSSVREQVAADETGYILTK